MSRVYSVEDILRIKHKIIPFTGDFYDAYGEVESSGTWIIWGESGSGKSSFAMMLCDELCKHGRVLYVSLEEKRNLSFKQRLVRYNMKKHGARFQTVENSLDEALEKLDKSRSPNFIIIDSLQYTRIRFNRYKEIKEKYPNKLFIYISHADGKRPKGNVAVDIMYDASMKIHVEGHRATSKGRFFGKDKDYLDSWPEKAAIYHGKK